jgi:hypothetical protein
MRLYTRDTQESDWPRAQVAVDLAMIRPVAVGEPALVGLNDVYRSVKPAALRMQGEVPVAKAQRVDEQVAEAVLNADGQPVTVKKAEIVTPTTPAPAVEPASQEVRKAEIAKPLDVPSGIEEVPLDAPPPIQF